MGVPDELNDSDSQSVDSTNPSYPRPEMPPPPYFQTHFIKPSSFRAAINAKSDKPLVSLFRLIVRFLQFAFGLASGISYAIELSHGRVTPKTNFIYAEVVFGITLLTLVIDSLTIRYYRASWIFEWLLAILWIACFGVFYTIYLGGAMEEGFMRANPGRMERAVWCNLINAVLWSASAIFSSAMCCTGVKAAIQNKFAKRRQQREKKSMMKEIGEMESGTVREGST